MCVCVVPRCRCCWPAAAVVRCRVPTPSEETVRVRAPVRVSVCECVFHDHHPAAAITANRFGPIMAVGIHRLL